MANMEALLEPKSVAIIGASTDRNKPGNVLLRNVVDGGYKGVIYPVNPRASSVEGIAAYASIGQVSQTVDLAIIVIGRQLVETAFDECIEAGVKAVVIVAAGFSDGDEWGRKAQEHITEKAHAHGIAVIGPNTLGFVNKSIDLFASFISFARWEDGPVAIVAQSGVYAGAVIQGFMADPVQRIGIRLCIAIGNRAGVSESDILDELGSRSDVNVIGFYLEQVSDIPQFLKLASQVKRTKPIILLKPGRTADGARAAASHTGALMADDTMLDQLLVQHGIIRADENDDFMNLLRTFSYCGIPQGRNVGIITYSGGLGVMATDAVVTAGLRMAQLSAGTLGAISALAPDWQPIDNPVDLWAAAESNPKGVAETAWRAVLSDPQVDQLLMVLLAVPNVDFDGMRDVFSDMRKDRPEVPIHVVIHGMLRQEWSSALEGLGIVVHQSAKDAARAMNALAWYGEVSESMPSNTSTTN